jgi:hypothetical protein
VTLQRATSSTAQLPSGSKSTRSARSQTGPPISVTLPTQVAPGGLPSPARDYCAPPSRDARQSRVLSISACKSASASRKRVRPTKPSSSQVHTMTTTQAFTIRACTHPERLTFFRVRPCRTLFHPRTWLASCRRTAHRRQGHQGGTRRLHPRRKMPSQRLRMVLVGSRRRSPR